ncbi:MAG TPA: type II secretion system protein GspM [Xanthomonadaceae bacterium]|nr:type II secretion system protein GspM [Xanthomonadaceae bacterium]
MRALPEAAHGRVLAIVLALIVLVLFYLVFVHFTVVAPHLELRARLLELRDQELRLRSAAAQRPLIESRLAQVRGFEADNPGFLTAESFDLATAGLIQRLQSDVEALEAPDGRCQVVNTQPFRPRESERFERVVIKVRMRCEIEEFARVLHALEGGSPLLFVDNFSVVARRPTYTPRNRPAQAGYLDLSFDLYGYLRQRGGDRGR